MAEEQYQQTPDPALTLSDQQTVIQQGNEQMQEITDAAIGQLAGVEKPDVTYAGTNIDQVRGDADVRPGSEYVSPEATVAGQLETLLNQESEYMKSAQRRSDERAAQLGLLGSSMAVGAGERAAIESALPIAQQDAQTFAQAGLAQQKTSNEISRMKAESDLSAAAREHVYDIDVAKGQVQNTFNQIMENAKMQGNMALETTLTQVKSQWDAEVQTTLKNLDAELQQKLQAQEISAREREYASQSSSQIMAAAYGTINDLLGNADFMAGYADNPQALTDVFNNFINLAKNQTEFIGATAGLGDEYFGENGYGNLIGKWTTDLGGYTSPA